MPALRFPLAAAALVVAAAAAAVAVRADSVTFYLTTHGGHDSGINNPLLYQANFTLDDGEAVDDDADMMMTKKQKMQMGLLRSSSSTAAGRVIPLREKQGPAPSHKHSSSSSSSSSSKNPSSPPGSGSGSGSGAAPPLGTLFSAAAAQAAGLAELRGMAAPGAFPATAALYGERSVLVAAAYKKASQLVSTGARPGGWAAQAPGAAVPLSQGAPLSHPYGLDVGPNVSSSGSGSGGGGDSGDSGRYLAVVTNQDTGTVLVAPLAGGSVLEWGQAPLATLPDPRDVALCGRWAVTVSSTGNYVATVDTTTSSSSGGGNGDRANNGIVGQAPLNHPIGVLRDPTTGVVYVSYEVDSSEDAAAAGGDVGNDADRLQKKKKKKGGIAVFAVGDESGSLKLLRQYTSSLLPHPVGMAWASVGRAILVPSQDDLTVNIVDVVTQTVQTVLTDLPGPPEQVLVVPPPY